MYIEKKVWVLAGVETTRATSWENLLMPYANNKGANQPAHLISAFAVRCLDNIILLVSVPEISSLYLASVAAHVSLSLP